MPLAIDHGLSRGGPNSLSPAGDVRVPRTIAPAGRHAPDLSGSSAAARAMDHGGNAAQVQAMLGHASLATTSRYVAIHQQAALRTAIPLLPTA